MRGRQRPADTLRSSPTRPVPPSSPVEGGAGRVPFSVPVSVRRAVPSRPRGRVETTVAAMASDLFHRLPVEWRTAILPYVDRTVADRLSDFVLGEYATRQVYPPIEDLFNAYRLCSPGQTRVLILGQDPYHQPGQAHGLSFSVRPGVPIPPSLRNIYKELRDDI